MSLINQALHSLDRASAAGSASAHHAIADSATAAPPRKRPQALRLTSIVLAGSVAMVLVAPDAWQPHSLLQRWTTPTSPKAELPVETPNAKTDVQTTLQATVQPAAAAPKPEPPAAEPSRAATPALAAPASPLPLPSAAGVQLAMAHPSDAGWPARLTGTAVRPAQTTALSAEGAGGSAAKPVPGALAQVALAAPVTTPARIDRRSTSPAPPRTSVLWQQAVEQLNTGQRRMALASVGELLSLEPQHEAARHLGAVLQHEAGHTDLALSLLAAGLALNAQQPALALLQARLQAAQGQGDLALQSLDLPGVHGADADGLRAAILAQRGDYALALPAYESALRSQPGNATWWAGLGVALESIGHGDKARQAYQQARAIGIARADLAGYVDQRIRALD